MLLKAGRWHVLTATLLLLHVVRVRKCLLWVHANIWHVAWRHVVRGHRWPVRLGREMCRISRLLRSLDGICIVYAIVAGGRLRRVQARLGVQSQLEDASRRGRERKPRLRVRSHKDVPE